MKKPENFNMTADEILELIKQRQEINNKLHSKSDMADEYKEYRALQIEILEKRQQLHQLKCDLTELDAMLQGSYPPHYIYWWEAEQLEAWNRTKHHFEKHETANNLRDILKKKRQILKDEEDL